EFLVGAAELDIGLERNRIVRLRQRVEELMDRNRLARTVAGLEIVPLQHARHGALGAELDQSLGAERAQPAAVEINQGALGVEELEDLGAVGFGVLLDLLAGKSRAGFAAPGGIANHAGEIADQENDLMPEVLEMLELAQQTVWPRCRSGAVGSKPA